MWNGWLKVLLLKGPIFASFLVACMQLYKPLCRLVGPSVDLLVHLSHFTFFFAMWLIVLCVCNLWQSALLTLTVLYQVHPRYQKGIWLWVIQAHLLSLCSKPEFPMLFCGLLAKNRHNCPFSNAHLPPPPLVHPLIVYILSEYGYVI